MTKRKTNKLTKTKTKLKKQFPFSKKYLKILTLDAHSPNNV